METESTDRGKAGGSSLPAAGGGEGSPQSGGTDESPESQRVEHGSGADALEAEWQFEAGDLKEIEAWLDARRSREGFSVFTVGPVVTRNLADSYYDTPDWMLYRAGYSLRIRQRGKSAEATLKSVESAAGGLEQGLRQRREISESLESGEVSALRESEGRVGERLRALAGRKELEKLFEIKTRRRVCELRPEDSGEGSDAGALGEIALDEAEIPLGEGEAPARLRRVEIEALPEALAGTASRDLGHLVEELRSDHGLSLARISKYEAGLYSTGLIPDDQPEFGQTRVSSSLSTGEVAYAVLRRQFAALHSSEPGARLGEDPEEVHDMRVASRRMRAAIKLFREALPERALWLGGELRWLAGALGEVRDLDVELEELRAWTASKEAGKVPAGSADSTGSSESRDSTAPAEAFEGLVEAVEEQRGRARERMLQTLDSARYERLLASFAAMLRRGPAPVARGTSGTPGPGRKGQKGSETDAPITEAAPRLLSRRYKKFREAARAISGDDASPEDYHELRKKGKSLRYALEFHREVYGSPVEDLIRPLKSLQDDLGRHQDAVVGARQLQRLQEHGIGDDHGLSGAAIFTMGAYSERYRREAAELREEIRYSKTFRTLSSRRTQRELEKKLHKRR